MVDIIWNYTAASAKNCITALQDKTLSLIGDDITRF